MFYELRQRFDAWRRERLDRKLLRIRMRYEDPEEYGFTELREFALTPEEEEREWLEASALFGDGVGVNSKRLPVTFKAKEVIGAHPNFDVEEYNEACQLTYGPLEYQRKKLLSELRNSYGEPFAKPEPKVLESFGRVKSTDTNPLQGEH